MSIDERDDLEDETEVVVDGLVFVATLEVIDSYGSKYSIDVTESGLPSVTAG